MGNAFSKKGVITRMVEAIPGGGLITAPFHYAAGNSEEGDNALVNTVKQFTAPFNPVTVIQKSVARSKAKPIANTLSVSTRSAVAQIFTESCLNNDYKTAALQAMDNRDYDKASQIVLQAGNEKLADNTRQLSAESGGTRCVKSVHGTYLRAYDVEKKVDMAPAPAKEWERWYIEDWHGKVVFKAIHSPGRFLRALSDGSVDLVLSHPKDNPEQLWLPFKNEDGSWSFLSYHGQWLSADVDGRVYAVDKNQEWEHFWLEWWH